MKYLEFYSGIGGHRCAINELVERSSSTSSTSSAIHVERSSSTSSSSSHSNCCSCLHNTTPICLGAFDVSTSANDTYLANFPNHKPTQKPIERLTTKQLDTYNADLWVMSPPCQPYTRQRANQPSSKKDVNDRRAASFTHLTTVLPEMSNPPRFILLENVVGFETSESCRNWLSTLSRCKYQVDQFHLSPIQFGIPNNRPRYFCIAKRLQSSHQCTESNVDTYNKSKSSSGTASNGSKSDKSDSSNNNDNNDSSNNNDNNDNNDNKTTTPSTTLHTSLKSFLQKKQRNVTCQCWLNNTFTSPSSSGPSTLFSYLEYQGQSHTNMSSSLVPLSMLSRSFSEVVDLVTPSSTTSCCFTKSYGTYLKGTGSLVVMEKELGDSISLLGGSSNTIEEMNRKKMTESNGSEGESGSEQRPTKRVKTESSTPEEPWHIKFGTDRVRYFTPKEISKLLGFPSTHVFHESVSLKKKYALLGNSLHVGTVARLLHVLLSDE